jgi:hypothetical protein
VDEEDDPDPFNERALLRAIVAIIALGWVAFFYSVWWFLSRG